MVQMNVAYCYAALNVVFDGACCLYLTCSKHNGMNAS
jgi:hypothetical protein